MGAPAFLLVRLPFITIFDFNQVRHPGPPVISD